MAIAFRLSSAFAALAVAAQARLSGLAAPVLRDCKVTATRSTDPSGAQVETTHRAAAGPSRPREGRARSRV